MIRRIAAAAALVTTLALPAAAAAPELERVIELDWAGMSTMSADFTKSGKAVLEQTMRLDVDARDNLRGTATATFNLDGVEYHGTFSVTGHFDGRDGLRTQTSLVRADPLPYGLRWCPGTSQLTLYKDKDRAGHFLLSGTIDDVCGGRSQVEFQDR